MQKQQQRNLFLFKCNRLGEPLLSCSHQQRFSLRFTSVTHWLSQSASQSKPLCHSTFFSTLSPLSWFAGRYLKQCSIQFGNRQSAKKCTRKQLDRQHTTKEAPLWLVLQTTLKPLSDTCPKKKKKVKEGSDKCVTGQRRRARGTWSDNDWEGTDNNNNGNKRKNGGHGSSNSIISTCRLKSHLS